MSITLIIGPKDSGKTLLAARFAHLFGGEVIGCHTNETSVSIHRRMDTLDAVYGASKSSAGVYIVDPLNWYADSVDARIDSPRDANILIGMIEEAAGEKDIILTMSTRVPGVMPRAHTSFYAAIDTVLAIRFDEGLGRIVDIVKDKKGEDRQFKFSIETYQHGFGRVGTYAKIIRAGA